MNERWGIGFSAIAGTFVARPAATSDAGTSTASSAIISRRRNQLAESRIFSSAATRDERIFVEVVNALDGAAHDEDGWVAGIDDGKNRRRRGRAQD
jgi:hypothetical protein